MEKMLFINKALDDGGELIHPATVQFHQTVTKLQSVHDNNTTCKSKEGNHER
jgi:hypothetical protein